MLEIVNGNIFDGDEDIIVHQTNCLGIMGGGIALQVRKLFPNVYEEYVKLCSQYKDNTKSLLGKVQFVATPNKKAIANCFGQEGIGTGVQTDYQALYNSLSYVKRTALIKALSVAIPYNIGCGLAGGDWKIVESMIKELFENDEDVKCVLYNFQG